jgi:DNA-binding XRE family transcriptional regulator
MRIRTPIDLGALIRERRRALRLDQKTLADKVGVSRQWIVDIEKGKIERESGYASTAFRHFSTSGDRMAHAQRNRRDKGRWGVPSGRMPTTHILKPPTGHFDGMERTNISALNWAALLDFL